MNEKENGWSICHGWTNRTVVKLLIYSVFHIKALKFSPYLPTNKTMVQYPHFLFLVQECWLAVTTSPCCFFSLLVLAQWLLWSLRCVQPGIPAAVSPCCNILQRVRAKIIAANMCYNVVRVFCWLKLCLPFVCLLLSLFHVISVVPDWG